jgi:methylase of polypeptide subunit release factors
MSALPEACPLCLVTPDKVRRIREALDQAGYIERDVLAVLDTPEWPPFTRRRGARHLYLRRTRGGTPLETLVRLFWLGEPVALETARRALQPLLPEDWAEVGLLRIAGAEVRGAVQLWAYRDLLAAADWPGPTGTERYQVMGIEASSRSLAQLTIRRHVSRTLDLGTGCGILAFLAAPHSNQVLAVDSNPRALNLAAFNAQLNGLSNVEFHGGNLFEPVRGQAFDLVVCNPPFVLGPRSRYLHTDSGLLGDALCRTIVREAPALLREGGFCQLLCNWAHVAGQDWKVRLGGWFEGIGCDAWVLHFRTEDAAAYASARIAETEEDPDRAARQFEEWMAYYARERIEAVGFGLITLRRSTRPAHWFRCDTAPEVRGPCGESVVRGFELRDFLEVNRDDRALLDARLRPAPELRWEQELVLSADGWSAVQSRLRMAEGLAYAGNADPDVVDFVARCQGGQRVGDLIRDLVAPAGEEPDRLIPARLRVVRRLVELGCLLPAEDA